MGGEYRSHRIHIYALPMTNFKEKHRTKIQNMVQVEGEILVNKILSELTLEERFNLIRGVVSRTNPTKRRPATYQEFQDWVLLA